MFSTKATKIDQIFTIWRLIIVSVKWMVKIFPIFVAFLENINFMSIKDFLKF